MKICGIDSSSVKTGISLFRGGKLAKYTLVDLHKMKDSEERINQMILGIYKVLEQYKPDVIYQESAWVSRNARTALVLSSIVGAIRGWALAHNCKWVQITPSAWRKQLNIKSYNKDRKQLKEASVSFVAEQYGIEVGDDVADAICIGLTGSQTEEK